MYVAGLGARAAAKRFAWSKKLTPEQITDFHEELAATVNEAVAANQPGAVWDAGDRARQLITKAGKKIFKIAVVADVLGGSGMGQISKQKIEVHIPCGCQRTQIRVRQQTVVLCDHAKRQGGRELVVPLRANDVIVKSSVLKGAFEDTVENVSVINFEMTSHLQTHGLDDGGLIGGDRELAGRDIDEHDAIANHSGVEGQLAKRAALEHKSDTALDVFVITRKACEVGGPQGVGFIGDDWRHNEIRFEVEDPIKAVELLQVDSVVVPDICGIALRSMEDKMFAFRPPVEMKVLAGVADVGTGNESGVGVEVGSDVLVHEFIGEAAADIVEDGVGVASKVVD